MIIIYGQTSLYHLFSRQRDTGGATNYPSPPPGEGGAKFLARLNLRGDNSKYLFREYSSFLSCRFSPQNNGHISPVHVL